MIGVLLEAFPVLDMEAFHRSAPRRQIGLVQVWYTGWWVTIHSCHRIERHGRTDSVAYAGLGGGIVKVPAECKASGGELKKGVGVTIYHLVESIEEASSSIVSKLYLDL